MTFDPVWPLVAVVGAALVALFWWRGRSWPMQRLVVLALIGVMALQPRLGGGSEPRPPTSADVVVIIDRTTSMGAEDFAGGRPRVEGVAQDVAALTAAMPRARYAVVVADNTARVGLPWTTDTAAVQTLADTIGWREESYGSGSDVAAGEPVALALLEQSRSKRPAARRYVIYCGDGEQTAQSAPGSFADLAPLIDDALVLGYGTRSGGVMRVRPDSTDLVERGGVPQTSTIDEGVLQGIAAELGGRYAHRDGTAALTFWDAGQAGDVGAEGEPGWPLGWVAALLAGVLVVVELAVAARRARTASGEVE